MKVFISWSGEPSKTVASFLHEWLPSVIQSVRPWMSASDIDAGRRWTGELGKELQQSNFGIVCLTGSNQHAPWLVFEAGALAKTLDESHLVPYLIDLAPTEITGPLSQFQAKRANKDETWGLISTINSVAENALTEGYLRRAFEAGWPELEQTLGDLPSEPTSASPRRTADEMMEEVLTLVRDLAQRASAGGSSPSDFAFTVPLHAAQKAYQALFLAYPAEIQSLLERGAYSDRLRSVLHAGLMTPHNLETLLQDEHHRLSAEWSKLLSGKETEQENNSGSKITEDRPTEEEEPA